jgi:hypothetical protein
VKNIVFIIFSILIVSNAAAQTGIGVVAPINKFEVFAVKADPATSGATANGNLRLGATVGTHALDFGLSSSSTYAWLQARDRLAYGTYNNLALNPNGGLVGIGKSNPASALDVNGTITANAYSGTWSGSVITVPLGGTGVSSTSPNYIFAGPNGSSGAPSFRALVSADIPLQEVTDEFSATTGQTLFTLSNQKSSRSVYKLYINGVRISNTAYSVSGLNLTYIPANNSSYSLTLGDRVQIDYYY